MAKIAIGIAAFLAVFAVLVLVAGSIPAQRQIEAGGGGRLRAVDRGHVIAHQREARHETASRTSGASSLP
jgi:hypothetical protein